ncbi:MAG: cytochrome-c peroxidase [Paracoccaceae bacterium]
MLKIRVAAARHLPVRAACVALLLLAGIAVWPPDAAVASDAAADAQAPAAETGAERLRRLYSGPPEGWPAPHVDPAVDYLELAARDLPPWPAPDSREGRRRALGERLFEDPALSRSGQISCQSCHNRQLGWGDGVQRSFGHDRAEGPRNAPALFAAGARDTLFWDGRAATLEEQALGPLLNPVEMANHDLSDVPARLAARGEYVRLFAEAYGPGPIGIDQVADALATFQRHLGRTTRLDRFLQGDSRALDDEEIEGLHLFRTKARCANCHFGPLLTDEKFHNLGLTYFNRRFEDLGRYGVTGRPEDAGRFRTPSLRHVARTAPFMHNGLFPHLRGLVNLYAAGGGDMRARSPEEADMPLYRHAIAKSPQLKPLELSERERRALVAFLEAL